MIHPILARLMHERQAAEALHQLVGRVRCEVCRRGDTCVGHRLLDRVLLGVDHHRADTEAKGQKIAQRDRASGRHGVVERTVDALQHLAVRELGQQRVDRIVQPQLRFFDQDHGGRGRDRLDDRRDAENRVAPHRVLAAERLHAERIDVRLAAAADEGHESGHPAALDMAGHRLVHADEPCPG